MEHILNLIQKIKKIKPADLIHPERPFETTYKKVGQMEHFELQIYTQMERIRIEHEEAHDKFDAYVGLDRSNVKESIHKIKTKLNNTAFISTMQDFRKKCIEAEETRGMLKDILWNTIQKRIGYTDENLFMCSDGTIAFDPKAKEERGQMEALGHLVVAVVSPTSTHQNPFIFSGKGGDA